MRAAIYIRVSTEEQAKEGFSIRAQRLMLIEYCKVNDYTVSDIYVDDGYSAKDTNRPELQRLLSDAEKGAFNAVIVYKLDRFTRSVKDLYELLETLQSFRVDFISKQEKFDTTTAMGRAMIGILGVFAQFERELISERVRMGQEQRTREGKKHGRFPFGYTADGEVIEEEFKQMRMIRHMYMKEQLGFKAIAMQMNMRGYSRRGFEWRPGQIGLTLENPFYAGIIEYGGKRPDGKYPQRQRDLLVDVIRAVSPYEAVWTSEEYNEHVRMMRKRTNDSYSRKMEYWFTGLLRCGKCGARMHGTLLKSRPRADGTVLRKAYYMCNRRMDTSSCTMPRFRQEHIEHLLKNYISNLRIDKDLTEAEQKRIKNETKERENRIAKVKRELSSIKERVKKWQYMFVEELVTAEDLRKRLDEEYQKESILTGELDSLIHDEKETPEIQEQLFALADLWDNLEDGDKKEALNLLFEEIELNTDEIAPKGKRNQFFDAAMSVRYR